MILLKASVSPAGTVLSSKPAADRQTDRWTLYRYVDPAA